MRSATLRNLGILSRFSNSRLTPSRRFSSMSGVKEDEDEDALARPVIDENGKFDNPWSDPKEIGPLDIAYYMLCKSKGRTDPRLEGNGRPNAADWAAAFPSHKPDFSRLDSNQDTVQAIWIGHASLLAKMGGLTFLTDPVFSDRCSPFTFMGPKRVIKPTFELTDPALPHIDFVLISHNHYDHLDYPSVMKLHKRFGNTLTWYVPLKLGKWFASCGIPTQNVVELDWWQEVHHKQSRTTIALTPAQHWSNRGIDRRRTLWGGYAVRDDEHRFYFAGDTAYCPVFKQIGAKYGPFDLSAIPIGAYEPIEIFGSQHCTPEQAVAIHKDVRSLRSLGIHCCTFCLTFEPLDEPVRLLRDAAKAAGLQQNEFVVMQHGGLLATAKGRDAAVPPVL